MNEQINTMLSTNMIDFSTGSVFEQVVELGSYEVELDTTAADLGCRPVKH